MAISVTNSTQLRNAIQTVSSTDPLIQLVAGTYSVTTLAKFPCDIPITPFDQYSIDGVSRSTRFVDNTRIYQENIDGPYGPNDVRHLTLRYNSATSNNTAILRATKGTRTIHSVAITGQHSGWAGNSGVYMSLTVSNGNNPINTNLNMSNSTINVTGQSGFITATGAGGTAFLQSWNNTGTVTLSNNSFNENGFKTSFHLASLYPGGASGTKHGNYVLNGNTFTRTGTANQTIRDRGNRLESVTATLTGNTFNSGSYLDIYGNTSTMTINTNNNFGTLLNGFGIRFNQTTTSGVVLSGTPTVNGNLFAGYGLAAVNVNSNNNSVITLGSNSIQSSNNFNGPLGAKTFNSLLVGGQGNDAINGDVGMNWISGDAGDDTIDAKDGDDYIIGGLGSDTITTGDGMDNILYYNTSQGGDTITDFDPDNDFFAFRNGGFGFGTNEFDPLPDANFVYDPALMTPGNPTFIYDTTTGVLSFDADGTAGGAINIATLTGAPLISYNNIKIF
jgi:hypothetical protein